MWLAHRRTCSAPAACVCGSATWMLLKTFLQRLTWKCFLWRWSSGVLEVFSVFISPEDKISLRLRFALVCLNELSTFGYFKPSCESSHLKSMCAPQNNESSSILMMSWPRPIEAWSAVAVKKKHNYFCWPSKTDSYRSFWISHCHGGAHISSQNLHRTEEMWVF